MFKILVVEDDIKIRDIILENISRWGFEGYHVEDFREVLNVFIEIEPQLVLLDINLPYFDGFYWCHKFREISQVPIIFITSRDSNMDIVMAMNMGGDDFVQKPFSLEVLMARVKALLRRTYSYASPEPEVLEHEGVILNLKDSSIIFADQKIELSKNEFKIIYLLLKNCGQVVSREEIMQSLWQDESFIDDNTLTVNVNRLRKRLAAAELEGFIQTRRGQGYIVE